MSDHHDGPSGSDRRPKPRPPAEAHHDGASGSDRRPKPRPPAEARHDGASVPDPGPDPRPPAGANSRRRDPQSLLVPARGERLRQWRSRFFTSLCALSAVVVLVPLLSIILYIGRRGLPGLSLAFFTHLPKPVGEPGGGMGNAVLGSLELCLLACLIGLPVGIGAALYLAEVGRGQLAGAVRFTADVLGGIPSITVGVFVYTLMVLPMRRFSAIAGAVALAVVMIPTVTRSSEELLRLVPPHLREASLGLGVPGWRTSLLVVLRTALPGIGTGVMLAIARIFGETAPLLFTALNNRYPSIALDRPMASLPVQIYNYATSPYKEWQALAWTGALVLVALVFVLNLVARIAAARRFSGRVPPPSAPDDPVSRAAAGAATRPPSRTTGAATRAPTLEERPR